MIVLEFLGELLPFKFHYKQQVTQLVNNKRVKSFNLEFLQAGQINLILEMFLRYF